MVVFSRRLNAQLVLLVCVTLLASGALYGWTTAKRQSGMLVAAMKDNTSVMARHFAESSAYYIVLGDYAGLEEFLLKSAELPDIRSLVVCEPDGAPVADIERKPGSAPVSRQPTARVATPADPAASIVVAGDRMLVWQPIAAGKALGWLRAEYGMENIRAAQADTLRSSLVLAFVWVAGSALALLLVLRPIVRSLGRLTDFARQLVEHKGAHIAVGGGTEEISELAASLNHASDRLIESERQLVADREQLQQSEKKYRSLLDTVQEGIWVIDKDSLTTFVNPRMAELLGYAAGEMIGKHLFSFMDEQGKMLAESNIERRKQGIKEQHDFEFIRKDGTRMYARLETGPLLDEAGQYAGAIASVADISETMRLEQERSEHLRFFENMDRVNRAIQGTNDLEKMMSDALDVALSIFDCDRAFLLYPCDPEADTWRVPMERTRPEYPGALERGDETKMDPGVAEKMRILLSVEGPVKFGAGMTHAVPAGLYEHYGIESMMSMAIRPRIGGSWEFGIQQCSSARVWTAEEERFFREIGRRVEDGLTSLLAYRDLRASEERYRSFIAASPDGVVVIDAQGRAVFVSPRIYEMLERDPADELRGTDALAWIAPQDRDRAASDLAAIAGGKALVGVKYSVLKNDGTLLHVEISGAPISAPDGSLEGIITIVRDASARRQTEEEIRKLNVGLEKRVEERTADLQQKGDELRDSQLALMNLVEDLNEKTAELEAANDKLQGLDRLKSMFIASMSHELRTPLNSIIGFSSIMLNEWTGPLTPEQKENLGAVLRSGRHLLALINDVIDVSKIETGKLESFVEEFDVRDVLSEAVQSFSDELRRKGLLLNLIAPHCILRADRRRLLQCLLNMVGNAVKFTERGSIEVIAAPAADGRNVEVSVADTGIGIKEQDLEKLFLPFVRLLSPMKVTVPGTGLGLYLTRKLVREVLHGEITVKSVWERGSVFTLTVPLSG